MIVGFETEDRAWIVLGGEHDDASVNVYDELYDLLEVDPPDAKRTKPPCCDENRASAADPGFDPQPRHRPSNAGPTHPT